MCCHCSGAGSSRTPTGASWCRPRRSAPGPRGADRAGRDIEIALTSKGVVHEFWIPDLKYKQEAFPSHVNHFALHVTKTGEWIGRCAVYCGQFHYQMDFLLEAVTPQQFAAWSSAHQGTIV